MCASLGECVTKMFLKSLLGLHSKADLHMLLNGEYSVKLLPVRTHNTRVVQGFLFS